jgi:hypothetical protein
MWRFAFPCTTLLVSFNSYSRSQILRLVCLYKEKYSVQNPNDSSTIYMDAMQALGLDWSQTYEVRTPRYLSMP